MIVNFHLVTGQSSSSTVKSDEVCVKTVFAIDVENSSATMSKKKNQMTVFIAKKKS